MTFMQKLAQDVQSAATEKLAAAYPGTKKRKRKKNPYIDYVSTGGKAVAGAMGASFARDFAESIKTKLLDLSDNVSKKVCEIAGIL